MTVLQKILAWGKDRPQWQQAALQMLYESPVLGKPQREVIAALCRKEHGLPADVGPAPALTLAGEVADEEAQATLLLGIRDVRNVNALHAGQCLTFAPSGITLIFGDNGAGKSGYVRILKQVCRARGGRDTIHPHAYSEDMDPPAATIDYRVGAGDPKALEWSQNADPTDALSQVSILDSKAAVVYAAESQEIAYLPFGLDLFQRLATVCDDLGRDFETEINRLRGQQYLFPEVPRETPAGQAVAAIQQAHARKTLTSLRGLKEDEAKELDRLRGSLAQLAVENPLQKAGELDRQVQRVSATRQRIAGLAGRLSDGAVGQLQQLRHRAAAAEEASRAAAEGTFAHFPIGGLSEGAWKALWKAAEEFATRAARPAQEFPPEVGALCVLCQQPVGEEAADRLATFHAFLQQSLAADAEAARKVLANELQPLAATLAAPEISANEVEELNALTAGLGTSVQACLQALHARGHAVAAGHVEIAPVPAELAKALQSCDEVMAGLTAQAAVLRESDIPERVKGLRKQVSELEARLKLDEVWERVEDEFRRWEDIGRLEACRRSTTTTGITTKGKAFLEEAVTAPLTQRFNENLNALRLDHIPIEFAPARGSKGSVIHRVQLATKNQAPTGDILSEGEFRAIALAGFLAEVGEQASASTLVFDDPVSSLDLSRRDFVAGALVDLAKTRPVVIFTHDLPFAWQVTHAAESAGVAIAERQLWRVGGAVGIVTDSIATSGKPAKKRIGPLKQRAAELKKLAESDPLQYDRAARGFYTELRSTWERAVEDSLLNGGVRRFGKEVKTQSLSKLHLVTEEHMARLNAGMTKCSRFMHDQAPEITGPIPGPAELAGDAAECEAWVNEVKKLVE